jgi:hypothetical protein
MNKKSSQKNEEEYKEQEWKRIAKSDLKMNDEKKNNLRNCFSYRGELGSKRLHIN